MVHKQSKTSILCISDIRNETSPFLIHIFSYSQLGSENPNSKNVETRDHSAYEVSFVCCSLGRSKKMKIS